MPYLTGRRWGSGVKIATDARWECSPNGLRNWQCPTCSQDDLNTSLLGWESASVIRPDQSHPEIGFMSKKVAAQRAQWIGLGGVEFGSEQRAKSINSVYCRRQIGCSDPSFKVRWHAKAYMPHV